MNYHQIYSEPRHMRYIFFVDAAISYIDLMAIMKRILGLWGGALNPIVPVADGKVAPGYIEVIKHYDPDIIYYSDTVDAQMIKALGLFNPRAYMIINEVFGPSLIEGVSRSHLLSFIDRSRPLIVPNALFRSNSILLDYYELNFGIRREAQYGDEQGAYGQVILPIAPENLPDLHYVIHTSKPVDYADLASLCSPTRLLRSFQHINFDQTELVIAADTTNTCDLLYWWNRKLYEGRKIFYVTKDQLAELVTDPYFGAVLSDNCEKAFIKVGSVSLSQVEIKEIIGTLLRPVKFAGVFYYHPFSDFPYPVNDATGFRNDVVREPGKMQTLLAGDSNFAVVAPAFIKGTAYATDTWAVDTKLHSIAGDGSRKELLFPKTTNIDYFLRGVDGCRVNHERHLTYYKRSNLPHISANAHFVYLPTFSAILQQLIKNPVVDGTATPTTYTGVEIGEPGQRLQSFFRLFEGDPDAVAEYLTDKFWYDLLEQCCKSKKLAGDALSFAQLVGKCQRHLENEGETFENIEERELKLKSIRERLEPMVAQLVKMKVLLTGYTLACAHCGHAAWYPLEDAATSIRCSGCRDYFSFPVDPAISYHLSTLVRRNFSQPDKSADGNGTVIRSLIRMASRLPKSFEYSGQLNLYTDKPHERETDLDLVVLDEGEFVIGEAKNDSSQFVRKNNACLDQLYKVACQIRPDRIVLCCAQDSANKLGEAKKYLQDLFANQPVRPVVEAIVMDIPTFSVFRPLRLRVQDPPQVTFLPSTTEQEPASEDQ